MSTGMVRKQVYLGREQDRKLKALAARRGCTEAQVIRDALDRVADPEGDVLAQLETGGLLAPKPDDPTLPQGEAARTFLDEYEAWLSRQTEDVRLSEAVSEDRGPR